MKTRIIVSKNSIPIRTISIRKSKPKLTQPERVIEYLKLNPRKSAFQISRAVNLSSHTSEVIGCLETNKVIKGTPCECGKDKLYELVKV